LIEAGVVADEQIGGRVLAKWESEDDEVEVSVLKIVGRTCSDGGLGCYCDQVVQIPLTYDVVLLHTHQNVK
jgi:hypothetical protein